MKATPARQDKRLWLVVAVLAVVLAGKFYGVTWAEPELEAIVLLVSAYVFQSQAGLTMRARAVAAAPPPEAQ